eukprot:GSChrysophyteH2.ASY1.ANO1.322.1 assembled CDS
MTPDQSNVLLRRMKLLSKTQTTFLKAHLAKKLEGVSSLVQMTLKCLDASNADSAAEIKAAFAALKLSELTVDVAAQDVELSKELHLLRAATNGNVSALSDGINSVFLGNSNSDAPPLPSVSTGVDTPVKADDSAALKELTKENAQLKKQLERAQAQAHLAQEMPATVFGAATATATAPALDHSAATAKLEEAHAQALSQAARDLELLHTAAMDSLLVEHKAAMAALSTKHKEEKEEHASQIASKNKEIVAMSGEMADLVTASKGSEAATGAIDSLEKRLSAAQEALAAAEAQAAKSAAESKAELEATTKSANQKSVNERREMMERADAMMKKASAEAAEKHEQRLRAAVEEAHKEHANKQIEAAASAESAFKAKLEADAEIAEKETALQESQEKCKSLESKASELEKVAKIANEKARLAVQNNGKIFAELQQLQGMASRLSQQKQTLQTEAAETLQAMQVMLKNEFGGRFTNRLMGIQQKIAVVTDRYNKEYLERRKLHNVVQELKGNIRVYMRCRPPSSKEFDDLGDDAMCVSFPGPGEVRVYNEKNREKGWEFEETFGVKSKQEDVYRDVSGLVTSVMDGFNVCIFAYGQTGSGKTYTMSGPPGDRGVNTRALEELFEKSSARRSEIHDVIKVSMLEVYNEDIRDLLVQGYQDKLEVRQGEFGNCVPGLTECEVSSIREVEELFQLAEKNRATTTTNMNEHSSRSHMMLQINITSHIMSSGKQSRGKLNLVDLAGSERVGRSGVTGQALKEAQNINKSLSFLGDVIMARSNKQAHIPFRNSVLTHLLQDSLSKDSKTLMICCVSPTLDSSEETHCSLNFAARVRTVELGKASKNAASGGGGGGGRR